MTQVKEVKEVMEVKETAVARASPVRTYSDLLIYKQSYRLARAVSKLTKVLELSIDEGFLPAGSTKELMSEYSKLGFMVHNLWKEWRKI